MTTNILTVPVSIPKCHNIEDKKFILNLTHNPLTLRCLLTMMMYMRNLLMPLKIICKQLKNIKIQLKAFMLMMMFNNLKHQRKLITVSLHQVLNNLQKQYQHGNHLGETFTRQ